MSKMNRIEGNIERTRNDLAATLDELSHRVSPQALADQGKAQVKEVVNSDAVKYGAAGVGALIVALIGAVVFSKVRGRRLDKLAFENEVLEALMED